MDTRRLCCLLVHDGRVVELTVHDRDTRVAALERELRCQLHATATELELFVARYGDSFLCIESSDAQRLAFGNEDRDDERFLTPVNAMARHDAVHDHFPMQPPLCDGTSSLVHVLARVRLTKRPREPSDGRMAAGSTTARLVASVRHTRADLVPARHAATANGTASEHPQHRPASLVLRCASPRGALWFTGDDLSKTVLFVPPTWRVLASEIFQWLQLNDFAPTRGRRAVLVGAPRAGKSAFVGFLLVQLLWLKPPRPVCLVDVPGVTFARISPERQVVEGTRGEHFTAELKDPQTLYVFDAAPSCGVVPLRAREVLARSILVAPHLPAVPPPHTNGSTRTRAFVLPRWTLEEVRVGRQLCALPSSRGLQGVAALFKKWGGVPGRLCGCDLAASEACLETALARVTPERVMLALATLQRTQSWHEVATGRDSARWRPLVVAAPPGSSGQGSGYTGQVAFTSQYVCDRVLAVVPSRTWTIHSHAAPHMPVLWTQLRGSLDYLAQEEEEKHETPPPSSGRLRTVTARRGGAGARRSP